MVMEYGTTEKWFIALFEMAVSCCQKVRVKPRVRGLLIGKTDDNLPSWQAISGTPYYYFDIMKYDSLEW